MTEIHDDVKVDQPEGFETMMEENVVEVHPDSVSLDVAEVETGAEEPADESFSRNYVEKLRKENARYRSRAQKVDELEKRLHLALVAKDGRLADPSDLPFDESYLDDDGALERAITELIARKPGLKAQRVSGDAGAGLRGKRPTESADLLSIIKQQLA